MHIEKLKEYLEENELQYAFDYIMKNQSGIVDELQFCCNLGQFKLQNKIKENEELLGKDCYVIKASSEKQYEKKWRKDHRITLTSSRRKNVEEYIKFIKGKNYNFEIVKKQFRKCDIDDINKWVFFNIEDAERKLAEISNS